MLGMAPCIALCIVIGRWCSKIFKEPAQLSVNILRSNLRNTALQLPKELQFPRKLMAPFILPLEHGLVPENLPLGLVGRRF